jgi:hypothetical protein
MTTHSLYAWIKKFGPDSAAHNAMTDDQAEIRRLKKELKRATDTTFIRTHEGWLYLAVVSSITLRCFTILGGGMVSITSCHR